MCKSVSIYAYAGVRYLSQNANVYLFTGSISPAVLQRAARAGTVPVSVSVLWVPLLNHAKRIVYSIILAERQGVWPLAMTV